MWVTLEQTTVLPRRSSTITSSNYRGPTQRGATSATLDPENLAVSSGSKEGSNVKSQLPRARFAENPIIGPTSEANSRISRRKSALKSRSPNEIVPQSSKTSRVDAITSLTVDQSQTRRSSFTSTSLLQPSQSLSPKRHRANSMIAASETPWSDQYLRAEDASHPTGVGNITQEFDPFKFRQRAHSISDFSAPDPTSNNQCGAEAYEIDSMDPLPPSNPSPLLGYFMQQDAFFREKARRNLGLTSSSAAAETDRDTKYDSLDFSDDSRPVSSISSDASSFSSTLLDDYTPPTPYVKANIPFFTQKQNQAPPHSIRIDDESQKYLPLTPASPSLSQENLNKWVSNASSAPMVSPLERLSAISFSRPSISTRQRSGTVLPPKKPEIISEDFSSVSSTPLSAQPLLPSSDEKPVKPPARPPRSYLRQMSGKKVTLSQTAHSASTTLGEPQIKLFNKGSESSPRISLNPPSTAPFEQDGSVYGSARSTPTSLPGSEPFCNQIKPTISLTPQTENVPSTNGSTALTSNSDESRLRPSLPQKSSSRNLARASQTFSIHAEDKSAKKSSNYDSCGTSKSADDESDEFESADEGDENFWSIAEDFDHRHDLVGTQHRDASTDGTVKSFESKPSLLQSSSSEPEGPRSSQPDKRNRKTSKTVKFPTIGAFPRSESNLESSISSSLSYSRSIEDMSIDQHLQSPTVIPISPPEKLDRCQRHQTDSTSECSSESQARWKVPTKVKFPKKSFPPRSESSSSANAVPLSSRRSTDQDMTDLQQLPFEPNSMSRTCSLEGLAALRNSNSPSPQSRRKKSSSRSSTHFRQISKILNFCAKDDPCDEQLSDENSVPISVDLAEHHPIPVSPNPSPHHPIGPQTTPSSWKNSMPKTAYENLKGLYGDLEMRRQEVIWELCETEDSFGVGLRQVIEIFASPLRTPEGAWISGVPKEVAKLLDWLEDIVNLHSQMAFQAKNSRQYQANALGLVVHISEVFLELAPKLEIYQPYLVRFSEVTALIDEMVADPNSDFGEFVRMQSALPECGKMSLNSFLLKPVQRLMKYPLFFKQLCEVTPPDHPDHAPTICLLNTTDSMIRVLQEVKEREDEYEKLKALESKVKGLPSGFTLARRDRRLLAQGLLKRVQISARDRQNIHAANYHPWALNHQVTQANLALSSASPKSNHSSEVSNSFKSRMSYHGNWSQNSLASSFSAGAGSNKSPVPNKSKENDPMSFAKYPSSPNPTFTESNQFYDWMVIDKSGERPDDANHYLRTRANGTWETELETRHRRKNTTSNRLSKKSKESPVHVFVFSDLILLATRHSEGVRLIRTPKVQKKKKDSGSYYCALEDVGISRLITASDISGEMEYPHLLKLDVLPFGGGTNQAHHTMKLPVSVLFTFPDRLPGASQLSSYEDIQKERFKWLAAFHESLKLVVSSSKSANTDDLSNVLDPSHPAFQQIPPHVQERQERHWWSARHRLVCRELELSNDDLSPEPSDIDHGSLNSNSFDSLRAEPSQLLSLVDQHHPVFSSQPGNQHGRFFDQLKRSGLGLDFGF